MQYPLISEYIESVKDADNFATLTNLRPVLDNNGNPVMSSGNFAVVFKMTDGEKNYAVKCFTREQEGRGDNYKLICEELNKIDSPYILKIKYLEKEIFVDTNQTDETEFPVLAMDWVEGKTLSAFLSDIAKEYDNNHETWNEYETKFNLYELRCMPTNFLWMTKWLLKQSFAHGDLKPDNIVVRENGACVLIDYDGMFVPSMQGMPIACGGTQNFRHPYNQNQNLCKAVDNYAIAIIALSLQAFAICPNLISKSSEFCIISESDVLSNKYLQRLAEQEELTSDKSFQDLLSVFMHVLSQNTLASEWFEETIGEFFQQTQILTDRERTNKFDSTPLTFTVNGVSFEMIPVEGGTFTMGATAEQGNEAFDNEKPAHKVTLSNYAIGKFEVTQALWTTVMGNNPSKFKGDNRPVEEVSWYDCQEFVKKLNGLIGKKFRLPTEAEWEYAARGGKKSKDYKYSGSSEIDEVAWYKGNSGDQTHVVGTKKPNELGIYDMNGNVLEWCNDWYADYPQTSENDPTGSSYGMYHVFRGGCWSYLAKHCRVSRRFCFPPDGRGIMGFRLVLQQ